MTLCFKSSARPPRSPREARSMTEGRRLRGGMSGECLSASTGEPSRQMTERDRARDRARPLAHGVAVIAALDHPFRASAAGDDTDMMAPNDHDPDAGSAGVAADRGPVACEPEV